MHDHLGFWIKYLKQWTLCPPYTWYSWESLLLFTSLKKTQVRVSLKITRNSVFFVLLTQSTVCRRYPGYFAAELAKYIKIEAAKIITRATKLTRIKDLYKDTGWKFKTLQRRRCNHKILQNHLMVHGLALPYLTSLIHPRRSDTNNYPARNAERITQNATQCTTKIHFFHELPNSEIISLWPQNKLLYLSNFKRILQLKKPLLITITS